MAVEVAIEVVVVVEAEVEEEVMVEAEVEEEAVVEVIVKIEVDSDIKEYAEIIGRKIIKIHATFHVLALQDY